MELTASEAIEKVVALYHKRHDLIADAVRASLGLEKGREEKIKDVLEEAGYDTRLFAEHTWNDETTTYVGASFMNKTPDAQQIKNGVYTVVEISVSTRPTESDAKKEVKYKSGLREVCKIYGLELEFKTICSNPNGSNLHRGVFSDATINWENIARRMEDVNDQIQQTRMSVRKDEIPLFESRLFTTFNNRAFKQLRLEDYDFKPAYSPEVPRPIEPNILREMIKESKAKFSSVSNDRVTEIADLCFERNSMCYNDKPSSSMWAYFSFSRDRVEPAMTISLQKEYLKTLTSELSLQFEKGSAEVEPFKLACDVIQSFTDSDWDDYFKTPTIKKKDSNVPEPGCLKLKRSMMSQDFKNYLAHVTGKDRQAVEQDDFRQSMTEALDLKLEVENLDHTESVLSVLSKKMRPIGQEVISNPYVFGSTIAEKSLEKVFNNEMKKRVLDVCGRTRGFQDLVVARDVCENLISSSGNKRSKHWAFHAYCGGRMCVLKFPGKSVETLNGKIKFQILADKLLYSGPACNIQKTVDVQGRVWLLLKPVTLDLMRLETCSMALEKSLIAIGCRQARYSDDESRFLEMTDIKKSFCMFSMLCITPKLELCKLFDNLRYAMNSCVSKYSGYESMLETMFKLPMRCSLGAFFLVSARSYLSSLASQNSSSRTTLVRSDTLSSAQLSFGSKGQFKSFLTETTFSRYHSLVSEAYTMFFLMPRGLHSYTENFKILEETAEWQSKFDLLKEQLGSRTMEAGYHLGEQMPKQQTFCVETVKMASDWLNREIASKQMTLSQKLGRLNITENYYSETRNRSTKSMTSYDASTESFGSIPTICEAADTLAKGGFEKSAIRIALEEKRSHPKVRLVRKFQRTTTDRGIFISDKKTRAKLQVIEKIMACVAGVVDDEMISVPGEQKVDKIQRLLLKALRWTKTEKLMNVSTEWGEEDLIKLEKKIMFCSLDGTKWSPGDNLNKFKAFCSNLKLPSNVVKCLLECLEGIEKTELGISDRLAGEIRKRNCKENSGLKLLSDFFRLKEGKSSGFIEGNWLQGNLNFMSSLFGTATMNSAKEVFSTLYPEFGDIFFECFVHSDDMLAVIGYYECKPLDLPKLIAYFEKKDTLESRACIDMLATDMWKIVYKILDMVSLSNSIKISEKKSFFSSTFAEFVGFNFDSGDPSMPYIKIALSALTEVKGEGYYRDLASVSSAAVKVLDMSCNLQLSQLVWMLSKQRIQRSYGVQRGMANDPAKCLDIEPDDVPIQLGGGWNATSLSCALGGPSFSNALTLEKHVQRYELNKDEYSLNVLRIYKFLEGEFGNEIDKFGDLTWRVFFPKDPIEQLKYMKKEDVDDWFERNPSLFFVKPKDQYGIFMTTMAELWKTEVQSALVRQSEVVLRMRMMSKVNGEVVLYRGNWVTLRTLLAEVYTQSKRLDITAHDLTRWKEFSTSIFSKGIAWKTYLNENIIEVTQCTKRRKAKIPKRLVIREESNPIVNSTRTVLAWGLRKDKTQAALIKLEAYDDTYLESDWQRLRSACVQRLRLDPVTLRVAKKVYPYVEKNSVSRPVLTVAGSGETIEAIVDSWLKEMSFTKAVAVESYGRSLMLKNIYNDQIETAASSAKEAKKLIVTIWKFCKLNGFFPDVWLDALEFEKTSLARWVPRCIDAPFNPSSPEDKCFASFVGDYCKDFSLLTKVARENSFSSKEYVVRQTFDEAVRRYTGNLHVVFKYGKSQLILKYNEIEGYFIRTSIRDSSSLSHAMMLVRRELQSCNTDLKVSKSSVKTVQLIKKGKSSYVWAQPTESDWCVQNVRMDMSLSNEVNESLEFDFVFEKETLSWKAKSLDNSREFGVASGMRFLRNLKLDSLRCARELVSSNCDIRAVCNENLLTNLIFGIRTKITRGTADKIILRKSLPSEMKEFKAKFEALGAEMTISKDISYTDGESTWMEEEDEEDAFDLPDDEDFDDELTEETIDTLMAMNATDEMMADERDAFVTIQSAKGVAVYKHMDQEIRKWAEKTDMPNVSCNLEESFMLVCFLKKEFDLKVSVTKNNYWEIMQFFNILHPIVESISSVDLSQLELQLKQKPESYFPEPTKLSPYDGFPLEQLRKLCRKLFALKQRNRYF